MKTTGYLRFFLFSIAGALLLFAPYCCTREKANTLPELSTIPLTNIMSGSFISGGRITSDGGETVTGRGVCWSTNVNPTLSDNYTTDGEGAGTYLSTVTGLASGTFYYVRAYATNDAGTAYGNEFLFDTPLTDPDGNVYKTIIIGTRVWMTQNLKTTTFSDNTPIPNIIINETWVSLYSPGYCWYKNNAAANKDPYGALYNWFAVNTGKLCPEGWHVPTEAEWVSLTNYFGGVYTASGKLKETTTIHWNFPNLGASNDLGFTALPGGYRTGIGSGSFRTFGYYGWFWASTESSPTAARSRLLTYDAAEIALGDGLKKNGYSVRCIKN